MLGDPSEVAAHLTIRAATADDVDAIVRLADEFEDYLRALGDPAPGGITAERYLRDGFGADPAFAGLIAELHAAAVGYLLYTTSYDLDRGGRILYVVDLFVTELARGGGVGGALMRAAVRIGRDRGCGQMFWAVYRPNALARGFYEHLGARYTRDLEFMYLSVDPVEETAQP